VSATAEQVSDEQYDWDAVRARLEAEIDRGFPAAWQPEEPDEQIIGRVVAVRPAVPTRQYGTAPVVELEDPVGGRHSVWLLHKVLRLSFERQRVALGETVMIRYLGKVYPEGGGNAYDNYSLAVDRPVPRGQPDWDAIARAHGDQEAFREPTGDPGPPADVPERVDDDIPF